MDNILKIVGGVFLLIVVALASVWFFSRTMLETKLKEQILTHVQPVVKDFNLKEVKLEALFPFKFQLNGVTFSHQNIDCEMIDNFALEFGLADPIWNIFTNSLLLTLTFDGYKAIIKKKVNIDRIQGESGGFKLTNQNIFKLPIDLKVVSKQGFVVLENNSSYHTSISQLNFNLRRPDFSNPNRDWKLELDSVINFDYAGFNFNVPVKLDSQSFILNAETFSSEAFNVDFSGLPMKFTGASDLQSLVHEWKSQFKIPDLQNLKRVGFLPNGSWQGSLGGSVIFQQQQDSSPYFGIALTTSELVGNVDFMKGELAVKGLVYGKFDLQASYFKAINLRNLQGAFNLSKASVNNGQFLSKPANVPLDAVFKVGFEDRLLEFGETKFNFHKLSSVVKGKLSFSKEKKSELSVLVNPTNLSGFEQFIPMVSSYPMTGIVAMDTLIKGDWETYENLFLDVKNYEISDLNAVLKYEDIERKIFIDGPLSLTSKGQFILYKNNFQNAKANFNAIADKMEIKYANEFQKKKGEIARINAEVSQVKEMVRIKESHALLPGLDLSVTGAIEGFERPEVSLVANIKQIDTKVLANTLLRVKDVSFDTLLKGKLDIKGVYDSSVDSFLMMPIQLEGALTAKVPELKLVNELVPSVEVEEGAPQPEVKPILQDYPIIKNSKLSIRFHADRLTYNSILFKNIDLTNELNKGELATKGSIGQFYGGKIKILNSVVNLIKPMPDAIVLFETTDIETEELVNLVSPDLAKDFKGKLSIQAKGKFPYPHYLDWYKNMKVKGNFKLSNAYFNTFNFESLTKEKLANLHGIGIFEAYTPSTDSARMSMTSEFNLSRNKVYLKNFDVVTESNSQMICDGVVDFRFNTSLQGKAFITKAPVRGSVLLANNDKKNRLAIPITIRGNIMGPKVTLARDSIDGLLSSAIRYEANKVKKKSQLELERQAAAVRDKEIKREKSKVKSLFEQQ